MAQTTRLTCVFIISILSASQSKKPTYLEESLEPPHLEYTLANNHHKLEHTPPLHAAIGALSGIAVYSLTHNNVRLLILDLRQSLGKFAN
jgi:hypothetical protein